MLTSFIFFISSIVAAILFAVVMFSGVAKDSDCRVWAGGAGMLISALLILFSGYYLSKESELYKYNRAVEQNYIIYLDGREVKAENIDIEFYWKEITIDEERKVVKLGSTDGLF